MARNIRWNVNRGFDLHLLRGGPESSRLLDDLTVNGSKDLVAFVPNIEGGVDDHGIQLDTQNGVVKALATPAPKFKVNNFLLSAVFPGPDGPEETVIRIHVHDSVDSIWLTPSSLTIHLEANECRFSVLARFKDGVVGDITGCSKLSYRSMDPATHADSTDVLVSADGVLKAVTPGKTAQITATLTLPDPFGTFPSAPATVLTKETWVEFAKTALVSFVAGGVVPNKDDPNSGAKDSVGSVVQNATNILLISEGFRQDQRGDFNNLVSILAEELRNRTYLMPFPLLKNSVNFWSAFVPADEEGITVLGDWSYETTRFKADFVPAPTKPEPTATKWSLPELIHEVGLPILDEVFVAGLPDYLAHWQKLYGAKVTQERVAPFFLRWNTLAPRSLLNERNSVFGLAGSFRPRADAEFSRFNDLRSDPRRTSDANLLKFATSLTYGAFPLGSTWQTGNKDFGLVSFVCLTDFDAGERISTGYFSATLGRNDRLDLERSANAGFAVKTAPTERNSRTIFASVWAHECGHAFGLSDEYGDAKGTVLPETTVLDGPNVVSKKNICSTTSTSSGSSQTVFDKTAEIPWLWPRLAKAGIVGGQPTRAGAAEGCHFHIPLRPGHGSAFKAEDVVRFREWPVGKRASLDAFLKFHTSTSFIFKIKTEGADSVGVNVVDPTGALVDIDTAVASNPGQQSWGTLILHMFDAFRRYELMCPQTAEDVELRLIAEPILKWLSLKGPLTAEPGFDPGLCGIASSVSSLESPTNLPLLKDAPRFRGDIIGLYEGGFYHDCGVYRPAGRCKMRAAREKTLPYCHVCRYLLVDRVDPTQHRALDSLYPGVSL